MNLITALLAREFPNREARRRATPEEIATAAWRDGFVTGARRASERHRPQHTSCPARRARRDHYEGFRL